MAIKDLMGAMGYWVTEPIFDQDRLYEISAAIKCLELDGVGYRHLLRQQWCWDLSLEILQWLEQSEIPALPLRPVQCLYFEKSRTKNWLVSMHQDLSIPVAERIGHVEYSGWSQKDEQWFVQPPHAFLERMLVVRLHLDDCDRFNGQLRFVPGSHMFGKLDPIAIQTFRKQRQEVCCDIKAGGLLLMSPLLLHASSKSISGESRRVLHFLFGPHQPPNGLRW